MGSNAVWKGWSEKESLRKGCLGKDGNEVRQCKYKSREMGEYLMSSRESKKVCVCVCIGR